MQTLNFEEMLLYNVLGIIISFYILCFELVNYIFQAFIRMRIGLVHFINCQIWG